jgi:hypothetical protein
LLDVSAGLPQPEASTGDQPQEVATGCRAIAPYFSRTVFLISVSFIVISSVF